MEEGRSNLNKLANSCQDAFKRYPTSCSHAVWYVIKQYKPSQKWMNANDLVEHINHSLDWQEVQVDELSNLSTTGILIVGGAKENVHGHVVVVYPGRTKQSGGFHYEKDGEDKLARSHGEYALAMSTSQGNWPGAKSNGDKTVFDAWGAVKFRSVRFWKYIGSTNDSVSLLTPKPRINKPASAGPGQKHKHSVKRYHVSTAMPKKQVRWSFKTITDCAGAMSRKWQKVFK